MLPPLLAALLCAAVTLLAPAPRALERPDMPIETLEALATTVFVGTCIRIESKETRNGGFRDATHFHHMRIDRVIRDASSSLKVGETVAVISSTRAWVAGGQPPTYGSGHRGMPLKGGASRVYCTMSQAKQGGDIPWLDAVAPNGWQPPARPVVFLGADDEYHSEVSLPRLAACLETDAAGVLSVTHAFPADPASGALDLERRDFIANISSLRTAEAAVFYMRWREPDDTTWSHLEQFLLTGRPIVGLRTSTHPVRFKDAARAVLNDDLPIRLFGQKWITHAGAASRTRVLAPDASDAAHPILRGVRGDFVVRSWLYDVEPLPADCKVLMWGEVDGSNPPHRQPILWIREATKDTIRPFGNPTRGAAARRMAFTTLGHPEDFDHAEVRRLVEQMILWATGDESAIPADGVATHSPTAPRRTPAE